MRCIALHVLDAAYGWGWSEHDGDRTFLDRDVHEIHASPYMRDVASNIHMD